MKIFFGLALVIHCTWSVVLGDVEPWTLQTDNKHCWGEGGDQTGDRVPIGFNRESILDCYYDVVSNAECGLGFEFDQDDNGWCACGGKNTANSDCRGWVSANQGSFVYTINSFDLYCGSGFTYTSKDLGGSTKEFTTPGEGIENCRNACLGRSGCTGFEYNNGGDEEYKCGTYTGGDANIEEGSQKSSWTSCILARNLEIDEDCTDDYQCASGLCSWYFGVCKEYMEYWLYDTK